MKVIKRVKTGLLGMALVLALVTSPATSQGLTSKGDEMLTALRESNGSKAMQLMDASGFTLINHRGDDGSTALHIVIRTRNSNWVGYLLANGADKNAGDKKGDTPLILAARSGYGEGAARLLMSGAQVDKSNRLGETALIVAVQQRQAAIVSTLLKLGADPDKRDHAAGYSARDYAKRDTRTKDMLKLIETVKSRVSEIGKPAR
ncbi:MAG: ankyrin repeat domain-containing protein [Sphingomonas bacterium]|nr:ankyrin repeat domain-containing protein [Sphingomonas bacterium]